MDYAIIYAIVGLSIIIYSFVLLYIINLQKQIDELKKSREVDLKNQYENIQKILNYIATINDQYNKLNSHVKEFYTRR